MKSHKSSNLFRNSLCLALGFALLGSVGLLHAQPAANPWDLLGKYQFGQSRQPLAQIEEQIRKTAPAEYKSIESKLLPILKAPETTKDAKRYICRCLAIVGSAECVPAVAELLTDNDLSHPARMALEPLAAPAAGEALRSALPKVKGKLLAGVISSLGAKRDAGSVSALSKFTGDTDPLVAGAAIAALGQIGTEEAAKVLANTPVPESLTRTVARAQIVAASQLAKSGKATGAAAIFKSLMAAQQPQSIRVAALKGQIGALPQREAVQLIIDMVQGEDAAMRAATISAYANSTDLALKNSVARELPAMKPAGQLILLGVLADQPNVSARASILQVLKAAQTDSLRIASLECLAPHGEAADVPVIAALASDKVQAVNETARKTLQRMGKPGVDEALVALIDSPRTEERAVALATLANRRVESALPKLVRLLNGTDSVLATEAAKALAVMGKTEQLPDVAKVVADTEVATLRTAAQDAAKGICRRATDLPACANVLVAACEKARSPSGRAALLPVFVFTGGQQALAVVLQASKVQNLELRTAAIRALVSWPEAAAGAHLLELAKTTSDPSQAIVALRDGCLRLAEMEELPMAARVDILRGVLNVANRPEERKRAVNCVAEIQSLDALKLLQTTAKDADLQSDAVKAAVKLARNVGAVYNKQTLEILQAMLAQTGSDELKQQLANAIKAAQSAGQSPDGFILAWLLSGPYLQEGQDGNALFDIAFAPEKSAGAEWRPVTASKTGLLELNKILRGDNRVAYLKTDITSDKDQDATLELGSDDGVKAWLNGKVVHANNAVRPCSPGQDKAKVKLKQGANTLMLKITQGAGEWATCARLRSSDGKPLADVSIAPNAN